MLPILLKLVIMQVQMVTYLLKQFVHSLRGNAFDWYIDLAPECIDSWDQMECESSIVSIAPNEL